MTRSVPNEQKILSRGVRFRQILQALQALATCFAKSASRVRPHAPLHPAPQYRSCAPEATAHRRACCSFVSGQATGYCERADDGVERGEAHSWAARCRRWSTLPAGRRCPWCKLPRWLDATAADRRRDRRRRRIPVAVPSFAGSWSGTCLSCRGQLAPRSNHCRGSRTTGRGGSPGCRRAGGRTPQTRGSRQRKSPSSGWREHGAPRRTGRCEDAAARPSPVGATAIARRAHRRTRPAPPQRCATRAPRRPRAGVRGARESHAAVVGAQRSAAAHPPRPLATARMRTPPDRRVGRGRTALRPARDAARRICRPGVHACGWPGSSARRAGRLAGPPRLGAQPA